MKIKLIHIFSNIISLDNLLSAWQEFILGKKKKLDVQIFARNLMDNILSLHESLANKSYQHGGYESFFVNDPKRRHIHKASVRDRLLHHAVYRVLYPFFEKTFIAHSFSCRLDKGTHKAIKTFQKMIYRVSQNNTKTCWVLKCDIKKFFASIDHKILLEIFQEYIPDKDIIRLLKNIIESYGTDCHSLIYSGDPSICVDSRLCGNDRQIGLPLGNLTSQLFANVYMNVFDKWVKHNLRAKNYIRYADDFVFLSADKNYLKKILPEIDNFLNNKLKLNLHPNKIFIKTASSGVDFLGWVNFPDYRVLRKTTKKRMFRWIVDNPKFETLQSYLGLLKHGNMKRIRNLVFLCK